MLYLLFRIGSDRYALEARQAEEVIPLVGLKRIPQAPRGVAGLINYRGQPVPAVDLSELTVGAAAQERLSTRIFIINYADATGRRRRLGLIVEHATEMLRRDEREFMDAGVNVGAAPYLGPVVMDERGVIQLVRAEHLVAESAGALMFPEAAACGPGGETTTDAPD